jgi:hypothetical protein
MQVTAHALADALAHGQAGILEGQTHDLEPSVLGSVLATFRAGTRG